MMIIKTVETSNQNVLFVSLNQACQLVEWKITSSLKPDYCAIQAGEQLYLCTYPMLKIENRSGTASHSLLYAMVAGKEEAQEGVC